MGKNGETPWTTMEGSSPEKRTLTGTKENSIDWCETEVGSTNRKHRHEALDETNATLLSDFANDTQIESNCSLELGPPPNFAGVVVGLKVIAPNFWECF
jgi:hypothetical protein